MLQESSFNFKLFRPKGKLSPYVQGVWSASVAPEEQGSIKRWLQGDACSGLLFNLGEPICLDGIQYSDRVILLPVSKQAQALALLPGAQLAGIRFHPGVGFGVFGKHHNKPVALDDWLLLSDMQSMVSYLVNTTGHIARIVTLYKWMNKTIDFSEVIPLAFIRALCAMQKNQTLDRLSDDIALSQRQLERHFKKRMGMTIKQYQRILRVNKTLNSLKVTPESDLAKLAADEGFSDQSHMTREFKQIAKITPWQYRQLIARRQA